MSCCANLHNRATATLNPPYPSNARIIHLELDLSKAKFQKISFLWKCSKCSKWLIIWFKILKRFCSYWAWLLENIFGVFNNYFWRGRKHYKTIDKSSSRFHTSAQKFWWHFSTLSRASLTTWAPLKGEFAALSANSAPGLPVLVANVATKISSHQVRWKSIRTPWFCSWQLTGGVPRSKFVFRRLFIDGWNGHVNGYHTSQWDIHGVLWGCTWTEISLALYFFLLLTHARFLTEGRLRVYIQNAPSWPSVVDDVITYIKDEMILKLVCLKVVVSEEINLHSLADVITSVHELRTTSTRMSPDGPFFVGPKYPSKRHVCFQTICYHCLLS